MHWRVTSFTFILHRSFCPLKFDCSRLELIITFLTLPESFSFAPSLVKRAFRRRGASAQLALFRWRCRPWGKKSKCDCDVCSSDGSLAFQSEERCVIRSSSCKCWYWPRSHRLLALRCLGSLPRSNLRDDSSLAWLLRVRFRPWILGSGVLTTARSPEAGKARRSPVELVANV